MPNTPNQPTQKKTGKKKNPDTEYIALTPPKPPLPPPKPHEPPPEEPIKKPHQRLKH